MTTTASPREVRAALLVRREIVLLDLREEAPFATGHPLFAAQLPLERVELEAPGRIPRRDVPVVVYDDGEGLVDEAVRRLRGLDYSNVLSLEGGLTGWRAAGFECFRDVNSYSKAFGELVASRRNTPSLTAEEVHALIEGKADIAVLDARRPDEHRTMTLPTSTSVPGAELVLRTSALAPDSATTIVVHCAGRTRSIIGAQSLINAGVANRVVALRNGTIGWTLAGKTLRTGQDRRAPEVGPAAVSEARRRARDVAYRAGVRHVAVPELAVLEGDRTRSLYRFDVRSAEEYAAGHRPGFASAPGGQLVQEIDVFAPVRGARIVLADDLGVRADMTASWLAQMAWDVYVLDGGFEGRLDTRDDAALPPRPAAGRYRRPYEGTDHAHAAMRAYLEWELGLVDQLARDGTHGFFVI
jgi:rhodanese-related sulfurtransferase